VAVDLRTSRGDQESVSQLVTLRDEFSRELGLCKQAFSTKRHGRDQAHSILFECRSFLESKLGRSITNATLANLLNAGSEANGNSPDETTTEEQVRKNLTRFKRNNPAWRNEVDPRFQKLVKNPDTK
jgi:hypothetical protein